MGESRGLGVGDLEIMRTSGYGGLAGGEVYRVEV